MDIAFFIFWTQWELDYSIFLELIERQLKCGHRVTVYYCNGGCLMCPCSNNAFQIQSCRFCTMKLQKTLTLLPQKVKMIPLTSIKVNRDFKLPETSWNLNELSELSCDNYHFCQSILSSFISISRNPFPDWRSKKDELLPQFKDNLIIYRKTTKILQKKSIDKVFVYNGRLSYTRAVFDACIKSGIPVITYDFGCDSNHFQIYENHLPHDIQYNQCLYRELWDQAVKMNRQKAIETACNFFIKRRNKTRTGVQLFTLKQQDNKLPDDFDETFNNIVIYCSSEDEFMAVSDEWKHLWFRDQIDAISQIIKSLEPEAAGKKIKIYVRLHPNMLYQDKAYTQQYYALKNRFTEIIPCESPVDSYYLLEKASKVVVFGSTIGIEAAYWKNPAILADVAFYKGMNVAFEISNLQDLKRAILSDQKFTSDMEMVYAYGYYNETFGFPYKYVTNKDRSEIFFKNISIMNTSGFYKTNRWHWRAFLQKLDVLQSRLRRIAYYYLYERFCFEK